MDIWLLFFNKTWKTKNCRVRVSLRKHPFLLALRRWGRFAKCPQRRRARRNGCFRRLCKGLFAWGILKTCRVLANFSYGKKRKHLLIRDQTESNSTQIKVFLQFCHTVNRSLKFNGSKILIINTTGVLDFTNINMFFAVTKDLCHKWCKQN